MSTLKKFEGMIIVELPVWDELWSGYPVQLRSHPAHRSYFTGGRGRVCWRGGAWVYGWWVGEEGCLDVGTWVCANLGRNVVI